jgi:hypothetical protein
MVGALATREPVVAVAALQRVVAAEAIKIIGSAAAL